MTCKSGLRLTLVGVIGALAVAAQGRAGVDRGCGIYPQNVLDAAGGWVGCDLKQMGQKALWNAPLKQAKVLMRFVFIEGHDSYFRVVSITENADGTGLLTVNGKTKVFRSDLPNERPPSKVRLSVVQVARLEKLSAASGAWDFEVGSWDGDEIYVHCQFLEMERATPAAYRYSSVNIGCNQPSKLMPLVGEIAALARLKTDKVGRYY